MDERRGLPVDPLSPPSDAELLRRIQADDLDAFELFFERYRRNVYRTSYGLLGDRCAAEEVLLDTFARAYRHRGTLRLDVSPLPWLNRVAMNLGYSRHARRRLPTQVIDDTVAASLRDGGMQPEARAEQAELQQAVRRGIASLPEKQRSVVVLYYLQELSLRETATALGVALGTVKSRLHYAVQALRSNLEVEEPTPPSPLMPQAAPARREAPPARREAPP